MTDSVLEQLKQNELIWLPEFGIGYYPVRQFVYDQAYFDKYVGYEDSDVGVELNSARVDLTNKHFGDTEVIDIGIGSGTFVKARSNTFGFDVNPAGITWLEENKLFRDPWKTKPDVCTFWDSLEHISDFTDLLNNIQKGFIVSCPIYRDANHVLASKHFRRDEHLWYWSLRGFMHHMKQHGFKVIESNRMEEDCGREDIGTFVLKRI